MLLHAGVADRTMWRDLLPVFAERGYRAIAMDLQGFGEAPVTTAEQAPWDDVLETMDVAGVDRAALVGNSFGGAVALRVAAVAPERVTALVLVSAPAPDIEPSPELEAAWEAEEEALARDDVDAAVAAVVEAWTVADAAGDLRERVAAMQRRAFELQGEAPDVSEAPDPAEDPAALAAIGVPALVAAGGRDKPDFIESARRLADALPDARHAVIEDAGHLAPLETPEAFTRLVLDFLQEQANR